MLVNVTHSYLITVICVSEPFFHFHIYPKVSAPDVSAADKQKVPLYLSQNIKDVLCNPCVQTNMDH